MLCSAIPYYTILTYTMLYHIIPYYTMVTCGAPSSEAAPPLSERESTLVGATDPPVDAAKTRSLQAKATLLS